MLRSIPAKKVYCTFILFFCTRNEAESERENGGHYPSMAMTMEQEHAPIEKGEGTRWGGEALDTGLAGKMKLRDVLCIAPWPTTQTQAKEKIVNSVRSNRQQVNKQHTPYNQQFGAVSAQVE